MGFLGAVGRFFTGGQVGEAGAACPDGYVYKENMPVGQRCIPATLDLPQLPPPSTVGLTEAEQFEATRQRVQARRERRGELAAAAELEAGGFTPLPGDLSLAGIADLAQRPDVAAVLDRAPPRFGDLAGGFPPKTAPEIAGEPGMRPPYFWVLLAAAAAGLTYLVLR